MRGRLIAFGLGVLVGMAIGYFCAPRAAPAPTVDEPARVVPEDPPVADLPRADPEAVDRLLSAARDASAKEPMDRAALAVLGQSEDEMLRLFEVAFRAADANRKDEVLRAEKERLQESYKEVLRLSDAAVERFFTPEVIAATPWTDLLADEQKVNWGGVALDGFEHRIENGVLHMLGPAAHEGGEGMISIGDREQWRDLVLDIEFTVVSGEFTLWLRLPRVYQSNVHSVTLALEDGYQAGVSHELALSLIGSVSGDDGVPDVVEEVSWTQVRKGAVGISLPKHSEVRITRLRARILR